MTTHDIKPTTAITVASPQAQSTAIIEGALDAATMGRQIQLIQRHMRENMKEGEHFGTVPGCGDKKALLKAGAEKLCFIFQFAPEFQVDARDLPGGHREFNVTCRLIHRASGSLVAEGIGACSTMESKYRFRKAEQKCPQCGKEAIIKGKKEYGGGWLCFGKRGGCGAKFADGDPEIENQNMGRVEHDNPADYFNTCLKMAKKRAHVDATLTGTAASDIFVQDIEEDGYGGRQERESNPPPQQQQRTTAPAQAPKHDRTKPNWWQDVTVHFGQKIKGTRLGDLSDSQLEWLQGEWLAKSKESQRLSTLDKLLQDAVSASLEAASGGAQQEATTQDQGGDLAQDDIKF